MSPNNNRGGKNTPKSFKQKKKKQQLKNPAALKENQK